MSTLALRKQTVFLMVQLQRVKLFFLSCRDTGLFAQQDVVAITGLYVFS